MSGQSNAGEVYEAGDQRNVPQSEIEQEKEDNRFQEARKTATKPLIPV